MADFPKLEQVRDQLGKTSILLEEVQGVSGWESFAQSLHEKGQKLYITGSNASIISRELGTRPTERYKQIELFPFSYTEFCSSWIMLREKKVFSTTSCPLGFLSFYKNQDQRLPANAFS